MANDLSDTLRDALGHVAQDALKSLSGAAPTSKNGGGRFSGMKGLAAGAGLAAAAPLAKKGVDAIRGGGGLPTPSPARAVSKVASKAGDKVGSSVKEAVSGKVDEAGGAGGIAKQAASGLLPGIGGDSDSESGGDGMPGVGKGRRMPVQQYVDVAVPVETAYNQWTQFEDWPEFMHRVTRVSQEDPEEVKFATKIWGKTKEFTAKIETQRPDERIKWSVSEGITHTGVVTFHELAPRLTRIELTMDVDPGSLIEKAARGMRHIKRAVRADLHRFKAFIEVQEHETGAWRGVIEDGEVVEDHDESYDEGREYSDVEDISDDASSDDEDQDEEKDEEQDEEQEDSRQEKSPSRSSSGGSSRKSSPRSRSRGASNGSSSSRSRSGSGGRSRGSSNGGGSSSSGSRKSSSSRTAATSRSSSSRSPKSQSKSGGSSEGKSSKSGGSSEGKSSSRSSKSSSGGSRKSSSRS